MFNYTAFDGFNIVTQGSLEEVALALWQYAQENKESQILVFSDLSGRQMDFDLTGTKEDVLERLKIYRPAQSDKKPNRLGRPKLGVVPREISLLPKHWEWLSNQSGGASAVIRRLITDKMKAKCDVKEAQERVYTFLNAIAGNLPNFEEAIRFLYRKDKTKFEDLISQWPKDLLDHTKHLSKDVFEQ